MQMVVVNDKRFAVEERNGNISFNLTMMAKPFGKRPVDWLKSQSTVEYLRILSNVSGITFADLVQVREGAPHLGGGTWANDYRIAVRFAQWLDMGFAIAVDDLVYKLLTKQAMVVESSPGDASELGVVRAAAHIVGGQSALARFLGLGESTVSEVVNGRGHPSEAMVRFVVDTCRRIVALGSTEGVYVNRPKCICRPRRFRKLKGDRLVRLLSLACRVEDSEVRNRILDELTEGGVR